MRRATCGIITVGTDEPTGSRAGEPDHPDHPHAGHEKQCAPDQRDERGLAEIRLQHEHRERAKKQRQRQCVGWYVGLPGGFGKQPGRQNDECRLEEFGGLHVDAENDQPAPRALDLRAEKQGRDHHRQTDHKHDQRDAPDLARRQERRSHHHDEGWNQIQHMSIDEIERVETKPRGDRRARRKRQHDAGEHDCQQGCEHQPVHSSPPGGKRRAESTRDHGGSRWQGSESSIRGQTLAFSHD